jgi:hypothetical protein
MPEGVKRNRFHPDDRVRATLSTCGKGACTYLQQILKAEVLQLCSYPVVGSLLRRSCHNIFFEKVTSFFEMLRLELSRGLITQRTVKTFVILVGFDILEQLSARNRLGLKNLMAGRHSLLSVLKNASALALS